MFHNKGEVDDYVLLQALFLFSALLCCLSQFPSSDFFIHLLFLFVTLHTSQAKLSGSHNPFNIYTVADHKTNFSHRNPDTKTLLKTS